MEDKIQKLFQCFEDPKNEKLFELCISQISEIYKENPSLNLKILQKNSKLLNSRNWNQRVMGSHILARVFEHQCSLYRRFLECSLEEETLEDVLGDFSHLFCFQPKEEDSSFPFEISKEKQQKLSNLKEIRNIETLTPQQIDFEGLLTLEKPLYGYDDKVYKDLDHHQTSFDEEKFLEGLGSEKTFDLRNFATLMEITQNKDNALIGLASPKSSPKTPPTPPKQKSLRKAKKAENLKNKRKGKTLVSSPEKKLKKDLNDLTPSNLTSFKDKGSSLWITISFTGIYKLALKNLFHPNWEKRHGSCLVLKAFLKEDFSFLGYRKQLPQGPFDRLEVLKELVCGLRAYEQNIRIREIKAMDVLTRLLVLVALDRFGDFLFEKFYLVVRESACQAFGGIIALKGHFGEKELLLFSDIIKALLAKEDWQIVQSALYLLKTIISTRPEFKPIIFVNFKNIWLKLVEGNEEVQQLVTEIMNCYLETDWLVSEDLNFLSVFLEKTWQTLNKQDELSYATAGLIDMIINSHKNSETMKLLYPEGFDHETYFFRLLRFFHHTLAVVRKTAYSLIISFLEYEFEPIKLKSLETIRKLAILSLQNLMIEDQKEQIELLLDINVRLLQVFYEKDKDFALHLLRLLSKHAVLIDSHQLVLSFQFFESFSEVNPYTSLSLPSKPAEKLHSYHKRLILGSELFAKGYILLSDKSFYASVFQGLYKGFLENSSELLLLLCFYSEIVRKDRACLSYLSDCSFEFLEKVLVLEGSDLQRSDIREIEGQIVSNLHTMKLLLGSNLNGEHSSLFTLITDVLKLPIHEKRRRLEEVYNRLLQTTKKESSSPDNNNIENCAKQILFLIDNYVSLTKELQNNIKVCAVFLYLAHFLTLHRPPEKLNLLIRPLLSSLSSEKYSFFVERTSLSLFYLSSLFESRLPSPIPKVLKNVLASIEESCGSLIPKVMNGKKEIPYLYSKKGQGVNEFIGLLIEKHGDRAFEKYPSILETILSEIDKLPPIEKKPIIKGNNPIIKTNNIKENNLVPKRILDPDQVLLNLKGIGRLLISSFMKVGVLSILESIVDKLMELIRGFSITGARDWIIQGTTNIKIKKKLVKIMKSFLICVGGKVQQKEVIWEGFFGCLIERIYSLMKEKNILIYELLSAIYSDFVPSFIELAPIFIIQVLKSLNNNDSNIREFSFRCLGHILTCSLLQTSSPQLHFTPKLLQIYHKGTSFLQDFRNNRNFDYEIRGKVLADLRPYQLEGIKWLAFLAKYNLHGALCDDMGLGKTLQTLVVLQSEIAKIIEKKPKHKPVCLIICPPTLTEHWLYEIKKYLDSDILKPMVFKANTFKGEKELVELCNILIVSYSNLQKSIEVLNKIEFLFCVVDEGQVLKNAKTKIAKSIKTMKAVHRFVLTGTPIQNNILELWSIFDFLMPEFLGDEEFFKRNFSKMLQINVMKFSDHSLLFSKEQDKILKELHQKITPFILRREKSDVLKELPQKIIQDYYCLLTDMQSTLYNELEKNQISLCEKVLETSQDPPLDTGKSVFELMILLRKLCNHPAQLLNDKSFRNSPLRTKFFNKMLDYENSGKLLALKDLFINELGFEEGCEESNGSSNPEDQLLFLGLSNRNKLLLFSRFKETLDLIAETLLEKQFPKLKFLRLDGSVSLEKRFALTRQFNEDPEYKVLLLTTGVGGVGLNLSSANVVIMFDHDYNPMNDLQAIDRAHRIGQKNVLNVYRLIMKDTLEEKIMGIQKFKSSVAHAVINIENASIKNIKDSNILSLFNSIPQNKKETNKEKSKEESGNMVGNPYGKILENLQELWSEEEYKNQ